VWFVFFNIKNRSNRLCAILICAQHSTEEAMVIWAAVRPFVSLSIFSVFLSFFLLLSPLVGTNSDNKFARRHSKGTDEEKNKNETTR
jgi:hypothetical protein